MQPSGCLRSSACWLRCGGGRVTWGWCSKVRASSEPQFGDLREGGGTREAGSTVAESPAALYRVGTHQIRRWRRAPRSSTSQGRAESLCARIKGANREDFWGKSSCLTTVSFLPTRAARSGERIIPAALFQGCAGLWTAGCWLARRLHQLKASTTMDLGISIYYVFVQCVALRNLDLLIKTGWSVNFTVSCWERWSWVGDNNPIRSRLFSIRS